MTYYPSVSVVITCFNLERYIEECIESVLLQQYEGKVNILIGDDASSDDSVDIIEKLSKQYSSIKLIKRLENIGTAANVIDLYRRVEDEYIIHLDGDDVMLAGRINHTVLYLEKHDDTDIVCVELKRFDDDTGETCGHHYQDHYQRKNFDQGFNLSTLIEYGSFILPSSITFRARLTTSLELNTKIIVIDDYFRHLQLMSKAGKGIVLFDPLTLYRVRKSSSTGLMEVDISRRLQALNDMVLARKELIITGVVDKVIVNRGISGEFFAASLFFLRNRDYPSFQKYIKRSFKDTRCFCSFKQRLFYYFHCLPRYCRLLLKLITKINF